MSRDPEITRVVCMPKLRKTGIQIKIDLATCAAHQRFNLQVSTDIQQEIGGFSDSQNFRKVDAFNRPEVRGDERRSSTDSGFFDNALEIESSIVAEGTGLDAFNEIHIEAKLAKAKNVIQACPGISAIEGLVGYCSTNENRCHCFAQATES
jgi:hypothetical protein